MMPIGTAPDLILKACCAVPRPVAVKVRVQVKTQFAMTFALRVVGTRVPCKTRGPYLGTARHVQMQPGHTQHRPSSS